MPVYKKKEKKNDSKHTGSNSVRRADTKLNRASRKNTKATKVNNSRSIKASTRDSTNKRGTTNKVKTRGRTYKISNTTALIELGFGLDPCLLWYGKDAMSGEQRLWYAVLIDAIREMASGRQYVWRWWQAREMREGGGSGWVCEVLSIDWEKIDARLQVTDFKHMSRKFRCEFVYNRMAKKIKKANEPKASKVLSSKKLQSNN